MAFIPRAIKALAALAYGLALSAFAGAAIAALFGFAFPVLDLFNHIQPILFFGCLLALFCAPILAPRGLPAALALALSATGLVASGFVYLPEALSRATFDSEGTPGSTTYRLMTFNVFARNETPMAIVETVREVDPDILALQEYHPGVRRTIHGPLLSLFPHFQYCLGGERAFVGLYSKIPFEPLEGASCPGSLMNPDRVARIIAAFAPEDGARFTVATTHHDWPAPIWRQREQLQTLADVLSGLPPEQGEPLILAADFNSTPWSYALRDFEARSGLVRHTRNLPTFPVLWHYFFDWRSTVPILPIDHVMTRGDLVVHEVTTGVPSGSDHVPVIVSFSVPQAPVTAETPGGPLSP